MSLKTMPVLFFNLGGEMLYILDQRLQAQKISSEKCAKVINDIIRTMIASSFVEELFKHQVIYSRRAMRAVFDRLAHSSIMRLNTNSMDKLFDLMTMAVKYQVSLCQRPQEILFATFNHLDSLIKYSANDPELNARTVALFKQFVSQYSQLTPGQFQLLRATLLSYFQDQHVRVSIFLKDGLQNDKGRFVLPLVGTVPLGVEVPGAIRIHRDPASTVNFKCLGTYQSFNKIPSLEIGGVRATKLGLNIYSTSTSSNNKQNGKSETRPPTDKKEVAEGKGELSLLANLLGTASTPSSGTLKIDLFNDHYLDMEPARDASSAPLTKSESGGIKIDVKRGDRNTLLNIANDFGELSVNKEDNVSKGEDLLSLMDTLDSD